MAINFLLLFLLTALVYAWSKELLGGGWALLPAFLTFFSPHFINESSIVSLGVLIVLFSFFNFLFHPSKINMLISGMALGVIQLTDPNPLVYYVYIIVATIVFYLFGLFRDWQLTNIKDRQQRFRVRGIRYLRSLVVMILLSILIFYLLQLWISFDFIKSFWTTISHFNWSQLMRHLHQFKDFFLEPLSFIILAIVALLVFVIKFLGNDLRQFSFVEYLSTRFAEFSIILFIIFYWYFGSTITPILVLSYILIAEPLKKIMTIQNEKEIMIVLAHELLSFSAKWLVLLALVLWYLINTIYLYLNIVILF